MDRKMYQQIEAYMLNCMKDSAHDKDHVYRVLHNAMTIACTETVAEMDVLIAASLLHDIARAEQMADPAICHAQAGAEKAYVFLMSIGWNEERAEHVRQCIRTHRFRKGQPPQSIEAKILYDADKLDAVGAIGIARTLMFNGAVGRSLFSVAEDGRILPGSADEPDSFLREYQCKLTRLYDGFLTEWGALQARAQQQHAQQFVRDLLTEVEPVRRSGLEKLNSILEA